MIRFFSARGRGARGVRIRDSRERSRCSGYLTVNLAVAVARMEPEVPVKVMV